MNDVSMLSEMEESSIADQVYNRIIKALGARSSNENEQSLTMLTREEVAKNLHTTVQTVALLQEMGAIKAIHIGKQYLTSRAELLRFYSDFRGLDVSNRTRIKEAIKTVSERKK